MWVENTGETCKYTLVKLPATPTRIFIELKKQPSIVKKTLTVKHICILFGSVRHLKSCLDIINLFIQNPIPVRVLQNRGSI